MTVMYRTFGLTLLTAVWLAACSSTPPAAGSTPLPASMKGYELYSWHVDGEWHFTLITGTNRLKAIEEITTGPDTVTSDGWVRVGARGVEALQRLLGRLPAYEPIAWIGKEQLAQAGVEPDGIELPPQEVIDSIRETCERLQLKLMVGDDPGGAEPPGAIAGSVPSDFLFILDARRSGDKGAQHVAIHVDVSGTGQYEIYDSRGSISQDGEGMVVYRRDQVIETGSLTLDVEQLTRLWKTIEENHFFSLTDDYRMQIGTSFAFVVVRAGGRSHQVFNIGMEVAGMRAIVETVDTMLPEGIGVAYGRGYVP